MNRKPSSATQTLLFFALLLSALSIVAAGCGDKPKAGELKIRDIVVGEGREAEADLSMSVHYTGWVYDTFAKDKRGTRFDSSRDRGMAFTLRPIDGQVIQGWQQGIPGMKVGGIRELIIPPDLAYGAKEAAAGKIPANSTLIFEVEMLVVRDPIGRNKK